MDVLHVYVCGRVGVGVAMNGLGEHVLRDSWEFIKKEKKSAHKKYATKNEKCFVG